MPLRLLACVALLGLFPLPQSGHASPVIEEQTVYYRFHARSQKEIWNRIIAGSPNGLTQVAGQHAVNVATTEWELKLHYTIEGGFQKCSLRDVRPHLKITIRLPHWENKWEADPLLAENWDRYVRMVSSHEDIHRQYAIKMAEEVHQELMQLESQRRCHDLEADISRTRDRVIGKFNARNKWFDAKEFVYQKQLVWF